MNTRALPRPVPEPGIVDRPAPDASSAQERFHRRRGDRIAVAMLISVALHLLFFQLFPGVQVVMTEGTRGEMQTVDLPPEVHVPPAPEAIARPATPTVARTAVAEDVTIAPTTFEANPTEALPPPPKAEASRPSERPTFIPRDVEPRLKNPVEIRSLLARYYPRALREAGIGGTVMIWLFVDERGQVTKTILKEPSPYGAFNEAAQKVARRMEYEPAQNRDHPIGVWVAQRIRFRVEGAG